MEIKCPHCKTLFAIKNKKASDSQKKLADAKPKDFFSIMAKSRWANKPKKVTILV